MKQAMSRNVSRHSASQKDELFSRNCEGHILRPSETPSLCSCLVRPVVVTAALLAQVQREESKLAMEKQFMESMAAPDWELEDYEWCAHDMHVPSLGCPTLLHVTLVPLQEANLLSRQHVHLAPIPGPFASGSLHARNSGFGKPASRSHQP